MRKGFYFGCLTSGFITSITAVYMASGPWGLLAYAACMFLAAIALRP